MSAKVDSQKVEGNNDTMLAAFFTKWLDINTVPEKLSFGLIASLPEPKGNEVLIDVKAASINIADIHLAQDSAAGGWCWHTRKPSVEQPVVAGMDYAGQVKKVGPGVTKLKIGDRVCGINKPAEYQQGTWAEQTIQPEKEVCLIANDDLSYVDAAGVAMGAFVDAEMIKIAKAKQKKFLQPGCRCLVVGASGALGTVMLQMLRKYKGHVTAVCSGTNRDMVEQMGADDVIDYTKGSFGEQLAGKEKFQVVFDFVGGMEVYHQSVKLLEKGGVFVTAVGDTKNLGDTKLSCQEFCGSFCFMMKKATCGCCNSYQYAMSQGYPPLTEEVWKESVIASGARANIALEVPFAEAPLRQAMTRVATHHPGGRVVINVEKR